MYRTGAGSEAPTPLQTTGASSSSRSPPEQRPFAPALHLSQELDPYSPSQNSPYSGQQPHSASSYPAYPNLGDGGPSPTLAPHSSGTSSALYARAGMQESTAFPLPPHQNQQHGYPAPQAHLQSFPYTMNHAQQPQLADLMNSPPPPINSSSSQSFSSSPSMTAPMPLPGAGGVSSNGGGNGPGNGNGNSYFSHPLPQSHVQPHAHSQVVSASQESYAGDYERSGGPLGQATFSRMVESANWGEAEGYGGLTTTWGAGLPPLDVLLDLYVARLARSPLRRRKLTSSPSPTRSANIYFVTTHIHFPFLHRPRFLYSMNNPTSLSSAPSLSLIYAVLAISAPYHDNPAMRAQASHFYTQARIQVETAIEKGVQARTGKTVASLTVETVQALVLLTMIETGKSDHQRAFLSIGQAVRVSAMLGLNRMDEDRLEALTGTGPTARRLRYVWRCCAFRCECSADSRSLTGHPLCTPFPPTRYSWRSAGGRCTSVHSPTLRYLADLPYLRRSGVPFSAWTASRAGRWAGLAPSRSSTFAFFCRVKTACTRPASVDPTTSECCRERPNWRSRR